MIQFIFRDDSKNVCEVYFCDGHYSMIHFHSQHLCVIACDARKKRNIVLIYGRSISVIRDNLSFGIYPGYGPLNKKAKLSHQYSPARIVDWPTDKIST